MLATRLWNSPVNVGNTLKAAKYTELVAKGDSDFNILNSIKTTLEGPALI